jgi:TRAP-type C4-dicarboxylate transport system permease small subunit
MIAGLRKTARAVEAFNRTMYWVSAVAILLSSLILTYEVVMRYLLRIPTIWEIESAIYLGVLATFLGAAYGLRDGAHINIDLVVRVLSPRAKRRLEVVNSSLALLFCGYVAFKGWELFWEALARGWRSETIWGPPLAIPYFFLPFGMSLLSLQFLIHIFRLTEPPTPGAAH